MEETKQGGGLDIVVVGDGDKRRESSIFDLPRLDTEGFTRPERRSPPGVHVIEFVAVDAAEAGLVNPEGFAKEAIVGGHPRDEVEGFPAMCGVAVKRNAGAIAQLVERPLPGEVNSMSSHDCSPVTASNLTLR
jgi:hypothetical protein